MLASTIIRREVAWGNIATEIRGNGFPFTKEQCLWKWNSLKKRYCQKIENKGPGASGASTYNFEFFDEMDKVLGRTPAINPVCLASTSASRRMLTRENIEDDDALSEDGSPKQKKKKKIKPAEECVNILKQMQADREQQHQNMIGALKEGQTTFKNIMEKLIEKL